MEEKSLKLLPHNLEAESGILSAMMINNQNVAIAIEKLREKDFYKQAHRTIFKAIQELFHENTEVDIITIADKLKSMAMLEPIGGIAFLNQLSDVVMSGGNLVYHTKIILQKSRLRQLINASNKILEKCYADDQSVDKTVEQAESLIFKVADDKIGEGLKSAESYLDSVVEMIDEKSKSDGSLSGISTGFRDIDELTGGFSKGQLMILAARPAMGKTSLALNFAHNAAVLDGKKVAIFSMEMDGEELLMRMLSGPADVDVECMTRGKGLNPNKLRAISQAAMILSEASLYIDDSGSNTISSIKSKAMRLKAQLEGLDIVIIDYLQLMTSNSKEARHQQISDISRGLKIMAKDMGINIIALSQLNRGVESRDNKRPLLSDLRESGSIEQDADQVMFIYRDDYYNPSSEHPGTAEIIVSKNRHGSVGFKRLKFEGHKTRFMPYDNIHTQFDEFDNTLPPSNFEDMDTELENDFN